MKLTHAFNIHKEECFITKSNEDDAARISVKICSQSDRGSLKKIANYIECGHTLIFGRSFNHYRKRDYFMDASLVAVDMDGSHSPDKLESILPPSLMYYSFSHLKFGQPNPPGTIKEGWRYRAVWQLQTTIKCPNKYLELVNALIKECTSDSKCKDPLRLFYGGRQGSVFKCDDSVILTDDVVASLIEKHKPKARPKIIRDGVRRCHEFNELSQTDLMFLKCGLERQLKKLLNEEGHRYNKFTNLCYWLMNQPYATKELAEYVITLLISTNEKLTEMYINTWDKDYEEVMDKQLDWCDKTYA